MEQVSRKPDRVYRDAERQYEAIEDEGAYGGDPGDDHEDLEDEGMYGGQFQEDEGMSDEGLEDEAIEEEDQEESEEDDQEESEEENQEESSDGEVFVVNQGVYDEGLEDEAVMGEDQEESGDGEEIEVDQGVYDEGLEDKDSKEENQEESEDGEELDDEDEDGIYRYVINNILAVYDGKELTPYIDRSSTCPIHEWLSTTQFSTAVFDHNVKYNNVSGVVCTCPEWWASSFMPIPLPGQKIGSPPVCTCAPTTCSCPLWWQSVGHY